MTNLDITKPVRFINPQPGEEELIYRVVNHNELTLKCYIEPINLKNWDKALLPQELVSTDDIENL